MKKSLSNASSMRKCLILIALRLGLQYGLDESEIAVAVSYIKEHGEWVKQLILICQCINIILKFLCSLPNIVLCIAKDRHPFLACVQVV